jgi:hypothetical protein
VQATVRGRSRPSAYSLRLQGLPVRLANAREPERTPSVAIVAIVAIVPGATSSGAKPGLGEFLRDPLARLLGQARVDLRRDARVRASRENGRLGQRQTVLEGEPDERVPEVVQADALAVRFGPPTVPAR